jgi:hypothetical protein
VNSRADGSAGGGSARAFWAACEALHAVTYFAEPCRAAWTAAGARGFWMGYFVGRLAPLGAVGPNLATAVCFGFSPVRPARALPDGWSFVAPADALVVRRRAAAAALRAACPDLDREAGTLAAGLAPLVAALPPAGRLLGAANQALPLPGDPVERLWQLATTIREHRGDTHVALWVAAGFDGCSANVLTTAVHGQDAAVLQDARAWSDDAWSGATVDLARRGLVVADEAGVRATEAGRVVHAAVEARTDESSAAAYRAGHDGAVDDLVAALEGASTAVAASGVYPYPNAMGLPAPG